MARKDEINSGLSYTQRIHDTIAIPCFYNYYGFKSVHSEVGTHADLREGIDYRAIDGNDNLWTIQERFRKYEYRHYGDITFRYDSKSNNAVREYFKIKAKYFLYGVVNYDETNFEWAAVIVVPDVIEAIENNKIPYTIKSNKGKDDSRFIAVSINDIEQCDSRMVLKL
jgi:hypothetical protein